MQLGYLTFRICSNAFFLNQEICLHRLDGKKKNLWYVVLFSFRVFFIFWGGFFCVWGWFFYFIYLFFNCFCFVCLFFFRGRGLFALCKPTLKIFSCISNICNLTLILCMQRHSIPLKCLTVKKRKINQIDYFNMNYIVHILLLAVTVILAPSWRSLFCRRAIWSQKKYLFSSDLQC